MKPKKQTSRKGAKAQSPDFQIHLSLCGFAALREIPARPRAFVMENVPGLLSPRNRSYFEKIAAELTRLGYRLKSQVLTAADYGVPQKRRRLFLVGVKSQSSFQSRSFSESPADCTVTLTSRLASVFPIGSLRGRTPSDPTFDLTSISFIAAPPKDHSRRPSNDQYMSKVQCRRLLATGRRRGDQPGLRCLWAAWQALREARRPRCRRSLVSRTGYQHLQTARTSEESNTTQNRAASRWIAGVGLVNACDTDSMRRR